MKTATLATIDNVKQSLVVQSGVQVIAEWNMNRYSPITSVTNLGVADFNPDLFPIDSITLPNRPKKGILKNRVSEISRTTGIGADGYVSAGYKDIVNGTRYLTASKDSKYKYWTSPAQSAGSTYVNTPAAISNVQPQILYTNLTWCNKIVIGVENSYAAPSAWTVQISTDGTAWTTIATNPTPDADGRVILYRQANATWSTTTYRDNPIQIKGLRISVTQMNKSKVYFNLIEMSPRIESDLSTYVKDWSADFDLSDHSFVTPLGQTSSNTGSVTLSNIDARFSNDNPTSLYYGLLDKGVEFRISMGISLDSYATVNKTYEWIRMATMVSDDWTGQDRDQTVVKLMDDAAYLQTVKPNPVYYEKKTAAEIIWRLLDSIGYTNYYYEKLDSDSATLVPHFWADGEKTVWDIINEFAQPMQMAIYFDEYGILQIKTRNTAYNITKSVAWPLDAVTNAPKLADIKNLDTTYDYEANIVNVNYKDTKVSEFNNGNPAMEVVWEPEGTVTLRASNLYNQMLSTHPSFKINPADAAVWPFTGVVQIEGEFIRYTAKGYSYYLANGTLATKYISSEDEKIELDRLNPTLGWKNYYNGFMWASLANRGLWNTVAKQHNVDASGYTCRYRTGSGSIVSSTFGWIKQPGTSEVMLRTNSNFVWNSWYNVYRGNGADPRPVWAGTRLKHNIDNGNGGVGLAVCQGTNDQAYHIEIVPTKLFTDHPTWLNNQYEISFYKRDSNGNMKRYGPNGGKGVRYNVAKDVWYDIDVAITTVLGGRVFAIFINGQLLFQATVPSAEILPDTGRYGVFARANNSANFEYLYSTYGTEVPIPDEATIFDRITGGYQSNQAIDEFGYRWRDSTPLSSNISQQVIVDRYSKFAMDEFGAVVHEVREFDVKFSKAPVQHSRLYFSNEAQIICPQYVGDSFSAQFILGNRYRQNAVVSGEDTLTFGADAAVDQRLMIYGRTVTQDDEQTVTVKDDIGVRRRGEVSVDISSPWIQSKAAAQAIADWIKFHWSTGADEVSVDIFGNPFLQLGDVVSVNHPQRNMAASTHKYFVVGIKQSYSQGLQTSLTLRRAKI